MIEHGHPDIIDRIDALTDDAASWSPTGAHSQPWWVTPASGAMTAVELSMFSSGPIDISQNNPGLDIARHVGDPGVNRINHLRKVALWVGDNSVAGSPVNAGATRFLHHLLADVRDGRYIASDQERDHARALLDIPDDLPVIHGPCLVTGVGEDGAAAPLDENFQTWFSALLDELAELSKSLVAVVAREIGIPLEQIGHVTFARIG